MVFLVFCDLYIIFCPIIVSKPLQLKLFWFTAPQLGAESNFLRGIMLWIKHTLRWVVSFIECFVELLRVEEGHVDRAGKTERVECRRGQRGWSSTQSVLYQRFHCIYIDTLWFLSLKAFTDWYRKINISIYQLHINNLYNYCHTYLYTYLRDKYNIKLVDVDSSDVYVYTIIL